MSSTPELVAAVDVGTASARAGIFDGNGRLLGRAETAIETRTDAEGRAGLSSEAIWVACGVALRAARMQAAASPGQIAGLAFDATCSLVLRDSAGTTARRRTDGDDRWDTIAWSITAPSRRRRPAPVRITRCSTISVAPCRPRCRSQAHVGEAVSSTDVGLPRRGLRPGRFPRLARDRHRGTLALHAGQQVELSGRLRPAGRRIFLAQVDLADLPLRAACQWWRRAPGPISGRFSRRRRRSLDWRRAPGWRRG